MAGNPLIPECPYFCTSSLATPRHKRKHPIKVPESRGLYIALGWLIFESGFDLALHVSQYEVAEVAGNPLIPECLDLCTLGVNTPRHKRKHPIKVHESRELYIAFGWIIFESGLDLALHANLRRISPNCRKSIDPGMP